MACEDVTNIECTNKQLWTLIRGDTIVAGGEVIYSELKNNGNKILSGLTYYPKRASEGTATSTSGKETESNPTSSASDTALKTIKSKDDKDDPENKLKKLISTKLDLDESAAWELFCSYMMFEYKGAITSYDKLIETQKASTKFLSEIEKFYMRERLCLLLCSQVIIAGAFNDDHPHQKLFEKFLHNSSIYDWCKWLTMSTQLAKTEEERIETYYALSLLLFYLPFCNEEKTVYEAFTTNFKFYSSDDRSDQLVKVEALLMYSLLNCANVDPPTLECARNFLYDNFSELHSNPYLLAATIAFYTLKCPADKEIKARILKTPSPNKCVKNMIKLSETFSPKNKTVRPGLSYIALRCLYDATDVIVGHYVKEIFGTIHEWYEVLACVIRQKDVAELFLCNHSEDIYQLYNEALSLFPVEISGVLDIWASLYPSANSPEDCYVMIKELCGTLTSLAELMDDNLNGIVRPLENREWENLRERFVAGIRLKAGSTGTMPLGNSEPLIISWRMDHLETSFFLILNREILNPIFNLALSDIAYGEGCESISEKMEKDVVTVARFFVECSKYSSTLLPSLKELPNMIIITLKRLIPYKQFVHEKLELTAVLLETIDALCKFSEPDIFLEHADQVWPNPLKTSLVDQIVMGHESVFNSNYGVTIAFLKSFHGLFRDATLLDGAGPYLHVFLQSLEFLVENIVPAFVQWRIVDEEQRYEIAYYSFSILNNFFSFESPIFERIRQYFSKQLLAPRSTLVAILSTDEDDIQSCVICPRKDNYLLSDVLYEALKLLLKLINFNRESIRTVDTSLGLTLVQKLGTFVRHRLDNKLPTLAITLLKTIAEDLNMSLLSCLGGGSESFRDLLIQRLDFRSEDVNLKIAILEFLTVCVQTQPGLIQNFFVDSHLVSKIVDMLLEKDENLSVAVTCFVRALFLKGSSIIKPCTNLWELVMEPMMKLEQSGNLKIIPATLNIVSIQLYNSGTTDILFTSKLKALLGLDMFDKIVKYSLRLPITEDTIKSLIAIKQLITLLLSRDEFSTLMPEKSRRQILETINHSFWEARQLPCATNRTLLSILSELMFILAPAASPEYLITLSDKLKEEFEENVVSVQISLLALVNRCVAHGKETIPIETVDILVRVIARVFHKAIEIFDSPEPEKVEPLLSMAAATISTMLNSNRCESWEMVFHRHALPLCILSVTTLGMKTGRGAKVVLDCLAVMVQMTKIRRAANMLQYSALTRHLWFPVCKYGTPECVDPLWNKVFVLCIHLNAKMLESRKHYYADECYNFWGLHSAYLCHKLWLLDEMVQNFLLKSPDVNYMRLNELLHFDVYILHSVSCMVPYLDAWRRKQPLEVPRIIEGVFNTMRTAVGLLSQPNHLQLLISSVNTEPLMDFKLTPILLEVQTKLWEVVRLSVHIFWNIRSEIWEFANSEMMMVALFNLAQLCIKTLSKSERKSVGATNVTGRVVETLEQSVTLLYHHAQSALTDLRSNPRQQQSVRREIASEITTLCDGLRRVGNAKTDFLTSMCSDLEKTFKYESSYDISNKS